MKKIKKSELLSEYGIDLPAGKFCIKTDNSVYSVYKVKDDTEGCILVGAGCNSSMKKQSVTNSTVKYKEMYKKIAKALLEGERVTIRVS